MFYPDNHENVFIITHVSGEYPVCWQPTAICRWKYPRLVYVLHQLWNPKPFSLPHSFLSGGNGFQIRTAKSETAGQEFNLLQQSGFGHSPERRPAYAQ